MKKQQCATRVFTVQLCLSCIFSRLTNLKLSSISLICANLVIQFKIGMKFEIFFINSQLACRRLVQTLLCASKWFADVIQLQRGVREEVGVIQRCHLSHTEQHRSSSIAGASLHYRNESSYILYIRKSNHHNHHHHFAINSIHELLPMTNRFHVLFFFFVVLSVI